MIEDANYWKAKYERLNESLAKNKRLFSDGYSQSVIESQVKRIKRLEDDLSRANCELDKLRKQNAWHGVDTESFVDGVRTGELAVKRMKKCDSCGELVDIDKDSSTHGNCNQVWGRRGWRQIGEYDG